MLETELLAWLQTISSWYILLPLTLVVLRWKTHDVFRRWVAYYVIFNISFTILATILYPNWYLFYLTPPIFLWIVYKMFDIMIGTYKLWKQISILTAGFAIFVLIDLFWIEGQNHQFPNNIYPLQEVIVLFIIYYYLYIFSKEARQDFSALWVSIGIGASALITLIVLLYFPYLGFKPNTLGYFIWAGLGSFSSILSYSFVTYGLYIARPKIQ